MFLNAYSHALKVIAKKPLRLWGLSLLSGLISIVAVLLTLGFPALGIAFCFVIEAGMAKVYIDGLRGKEVYSDQLFEGTSRFFRVAGGMAWKGLWQVVWALPMLGVVVVMSGITGAIEAAILSGSANAKSFEDLNRIFETAKAVGVLFGVLTVLLVIAAFVLYVIKTYQYKFVPYILMTKPDVKATEALRLSVELTNGKKLQLFLADFVFNAAIFVVAFVLGLFSAIPFIGGLFGFIGTIFTILVALFSAIFTGLYSAYLYLANKPAPVAQPEPVLDETL